MNKYWMPPSAWNGQDAFIIGGGSSLTNFDFSSLRNKHVIGCNEAFRLGRDILEYLLFSDSGWFQKRKWDLEKRGLAVVSVNPAVASFKLPWHFPMERVKEGLWTGSKLGWNYSTGAAAINLAISLGAKNIYLLGFDLVQKNKKTHWHSHYAHITPDTSFQRFMRGFKTIQSEMIKFPRVTVFNVTDGSSRLIGFKTINFQQLEEVLHGNHQKNAETKSDLLETVGA